MASDPIYGFDAHTARTIVNEIRKLRREVDSMPKSKKNNSRRGKPHWLFCKTTLEPGGSATAYVARRTVDPATGLFLFEPNFVRGAYTIKDPGFTSFVFGTDDYNGSALNYSANAVLCIGDINEGAFIPLGENNLILQAKPDSTISTGGTGTFSIYNDSTDTGYNISGVKVEWGDNGEGVTSGKESWIKYVRPANKWMWIGGDCE
jgi:hypothetical protein